MTKNPKYPPSRTAGLKPRVARGAGWGSEAKGASTAPGSLPPFEPGNPGHASKWPDTGRRKMRDDQAEEVLDNMLSVALGKIEAKPMQVMAQEKFLERVRGKVPQANVNYNGEMSDLPDDAVDAELARYRQKAAAVAGEGIVAAEVPQGPSGVVC